MSGDLDLGEVMTFLRGRLPENAIITNGAGNYAGWVQRFYQYTGFRTQLGPTNGAMGYGVPSAIAAKVVHPDRVVVSFSGDGCFLMNGQELATAAQYRLPVVFVVINNGMYGTIRMHQEREYPARVYATALDNPDFAALARAYGLHGETVQRTADFAPAFERAVAVGQTGVAGTANRPGGDHHTHQPHRDSRAGGQGRPLEKHYITRAPDSLAILPCFISSARMRIGELARANARITV